MNHIFLNISCKYGRLMLSTILLFTLSAFAGEDLTHNKEQVKQWMQNLPVEFVENKGQITDMNGKPVPFVLFQVGAPGMNLFITEKGLTYCFMEEVKEASTALSKENEREEKMESPGPKEEEGEFKPFNWSRIDMELAGASIKKSNIITEGRSNSFNQYYLGHLPAGKAGCPDGILDVHSYTKITIKEVYPGIDWILYNSSEKGFKYDFVVHPGADAGNIKLLYRSGKRLHFDEQGNIQIQTPYGTLTENAPVSYIKETGENIRTQFAKTKVNTCRPTRVDEGYETSISFDLRSATHNPDSYRSDNSTLIIDPQLWWGTVFGGMGTGPRSITAGKNCIYIVGYTTTNFVFPSSNMPGAYFQGVFGDVGFFTATNAYLGLSSSGSNGFQVGDAFIAKFSLSGAYIWGTYYGGSKSDVATSAVVDLNENLIVTGFTGSPNFPLQNSPGGYNQPFANNSDAFILKFNAAGVRTWSTYYGGSTGAALSGSQPGQEWANAVCTDKANNIYITGYTTSSNLPALNAIQPTNAGLADSYIAKFNSSNTLQWSTYYGGTGDDEGRSIAVDNTGELYVVGYTRSTNFPLQNTGGAYWQPAIAAGLPNDGDAFFLKLTTTGTVLWSTYYGGNGYDRANSIIKDVNGNMVISGSTKSTNLPLQNLVGAYNQNSNGGSEDIFFVRLNNTMGLNWATYFGGNQNDNTRTWIDFATNSLAADSCGNIFFAGWTLSPNLPTVNPQGCGFFDNSYNNAIDTWSRRCVGDIFLLRFNSNCALTWSTYYGNAGSLLFPGGIVTDINNHLFVTGEFVTGNNPLVNPGGGAYFNPTFDYNDNGFILKFAPTFTSSFINPSTCNACNGTVTVNACWDAPFNYLWSNGSSKLNTTSLSSTITNLCSGNYWVEITSGCNQRDTVYFTLTSVGGSLTLSPSQTDVSCSTTGSATIMVTGGTPNYTYSWSPNISTGATATGLSAGSYTVTAKDAAGCLAIHTFGIAGSINPIVSVSATTITCSGASTGSATATGGSGSSPYTYSWSGGVPGSGFQVSGLSAGTYTVTVTDSKGCTATSSAIIISPPPLSGQFTKGTANCTSCGCKEWIMVNATGGTKPYTYIWPDGYTNRYKNQLCPGGYSINIKDKNGCSVNVNLTAP